MTHGADPAVAPSAALLSDLRRLSERRQMRSAEQEPLARHTTMGIGGPCPLMIWPRHADDVRALASYLSARAARWRVLGGGSNLLVSDAGIDDLVLNMSYLCQGTRWLDDCGHLPAGLPTARALRATVAEGLDGLVWAAGLPGTIGGAAAGNAGCWGGDMAGSVRALHVVAANGHAAIAPSSELTWNYRSLRFPSRLPEPVAIVTVEIALQRGDPRALRKRYQRLRQDKRNRQPMGARNSGCIFRNPPGNVGAGALIDQAGCKGMRVGDAMVSELHANFVINRGQATAAEVTALITRVREQVREQSGVVLRTEIRRW